MVTDYTYWLDYPQVDRTKKVASLVHRELSSILQHKVSDPRIEPITITEVLVSKDLKHAKIFVVGRGSAEASQTAVEALNRARSYIRRQLAKQAGLKYTPSLEFKIDKVPERSTRVLNLMKKISQSVD